MPRNDTALYPDGIVNAIGYSLKMRPSMRSSDTSNPALHFKCDTVPKKTLQFSFVKIGVYWNSKPMEFGDGVGTFLTPQEELLRLLTA